MPVLFTYIEKRINLIRSTKILKTIREQYKTVSIHMS